MNFANLFMNINPKEVLNNLPDAVLVVEEDGKISWVNDKAAFIFELDKKELTNYSFDNVVVNGMLSASKSSAKKNAIVTGAFTADGSEIFVEMNAKKFGEQYFITIRDITAMTHVLADAEKSGKLNKNKNSMLLKLANEFKSPVQSIIGFSQALVDGLGGELNDKQDKYVKIINKNSNELLYFLDKFFEFSKAESSLYKYNFQTFDIVNTIQNIIKKCEKVIEEKNLEVKLNTENLNKKTICSDEDALKIAIENIIDTSLKQTDSGAIEITVSTIKPNEYSNIKNLSIDSHIKISISDTSTGFAESELNGLFEPYSQLEKVSKKTLCRSIVLGTAEIIIKHLKGLLWVESQVMKGNTFNIILPVEKEEESTNE